MRLLRLPRSTRRLQFCCVALAVSVMAQTSGEESPIDVYKRQEYVHTGVVTDKWPSSSGHKPAPGTKFELPIMLICEIRQGKFVKVREYFDLLTLLEPGTSHRLYS